MSAGSRETQTQGRRQRSRFRGDAFCEGECQGSETITPCGCAHPNWWKRGRRTWCYQGLRVGWRTWKNKTPG